MALTLETVPQDLVWDLDLEVILGHSELREDQEDLVLLGAHEVRDKLNPESMLLLRLELEALTVEDLQALALTLVVPEGDLG